MRAAAPARPNLSFARDSARPVDPGSHQNEGPGYCARALANTKATWPLAAGISFSRAATVSG